MIYQPNVKKFYVFQYIVKSFLIDVILEKYQYKVSSFLTFIRLQIYRYIKYNNVV